MLVSGTDHRIFTVSKNIGIVVTGLIPDGRYMVKRARDMAANYVQLYGVPMSGHVLAQRLSMEFFFNTLYPSERPFGCALIIAAFDEGVGPTLFMVEPSGSFYQYYGCSAGKGRQMAKNEIEKLGPRKMKCKDAAFGLARL